MTDSALMQLAIAEAEKAVCPAPNPFVGAVLYKNGKILGRGAHLAAGLPHAEIVALRRAGTHARGATLAVTLEPCISHGRTPPCTPVVAAAGLARVIIGMRDPTPENRGGADLLRKQGIAVTLGIEEHACRTQNQAWFKSMASPLPYVTLKLAAYPDGSTIPKRRWISGPQSRKLAHLLRARHDAVLVGLGTVHRDNPRLTVRGYAVDEQPLRVVIGSADAFPSGARMLQEPGKTLLLTDTPRHLPHLETVCMHRTTDGSLAPPEILHLLAERGIRRLLIEGGAQAAERFLLADCVDAVHLFIPGTPVTPPPLLGLSPRDWQSHKSGTDTHFFKTLHQYGTGKSC